MAKATPVKMSSRGAEEAGGRRLAEDEEGERPGEEGLDVDEERRRRGARPGEGPGVQGVGADRAEEDDARRRRRRPRPTAPPGGGGRGREGR